MQFSFVFVFVIIFLSGLSIYGGIVTLSDAWSTMLHWVSAINFSALSNQPVWELIRRKRCYAVHLSATAKAAAPCISVQPIFDFLSGAALVVSVGKTLSRAASGYVQDCIHSQEDAVRLYTTSKFWIALGASCCELLLIKVLYKEEYKNRRRNRVLRWFGSPLGWVVLVLLMTIPNGIMPIGVLLVCAFKLSDLIYVPAILISNFMKPYIVAAIRSSPKLGLTKKLCSAPHSASRNNQPHKGILGYAPNIEELILGVIVLFAIRFVVVARTTLDEDDDLLVPGDSVESDLSKDLSAVKQKKKFKKA